MINEDDFNVFVNILTPKLDPFTNKFTTGFPTVELPSFFSTAVTLIIRPVTDPNLMDFADFVGTAMYLAPLMKISAAVEAVLMKVNTISFSCFPEKKNKSNDVKKFMVKKGFSGVYSIYFRL